MTFHEEYRDLEDRFKALAEADGDVYLPNVEPPGPVRYVFVAMEPSLGRWAPSPQEARARVEAGFRNFVTDQVVDVMFLHHAIRHYLGTESYHMTDFSKGAMLTAHANLDRPARYDRWYPLLRAELALVGPDAQIFAVGGKVASNLEKRGTRFTQILHYSDQAGQARAAAVRGHESEFEAFKTTVSFKDVRATAKKVLELVPAELRAENRGRTRTRTRLSTSELQLLFAYKLTFKGLGYTAENGIAERERDVPTSTSESSSAAVDARVAQPTRHQTWTCEFCGETWPATTQFWYRNHKTEMPERERDKFGADGQLLYLTGRCKPCERKYRSRLAGGTN